MSTSDHVDAATHLPRGAFEGSENVLVLAPTMGPSEGELCADLVFTTPPGRTNLLAVTMTQSADDRLDVWRRARGELPTRIRIVEVGGSRRSAAGASQPIDSGGVSVANAGDPGDLTGLGIVLTETLSEWADGAHRMVFCFHSLTPLLQHADLNRVYRFLHVLTGHLSSSGVASHFHLDPAAHDNRTVNTLKTLFDAVVEPDGDGWSIRRR